MMKKTVWILPLLIVTPLLAVSPLFWETRSYEDFRKGTFSNLSLTNEDRLVLAPRFDSVFNAEQPFIWSSAADSRPGEVLDCDSSRAARTCSRPTTT